MMYHKINDFNSSDGFKIRRFISGCFASTTAAVTTSGWPNIGEFKKVEYQVSILIYL